jgi:hypothetical protein
MHRNATPRRRSARIAFDLLTSETMVRKDIIVESPHGPHELAPTPVDYIVESDALTGIASSFPFRERLHVVTSTSRLLRP